MLFYSAVSHYFISLSVNSPNYPHDGPALVLPSPLPLPPKVTKPVVASALAPSTPSRKRALDIDGDVDGAPPTKRAKESSAPNINLASPSKKRRFEEDGLLMLEDPNEKIEEGEGPQLITIDDD